MARSASAVGIAVLLSRVLGLVREQVFAALFGAGRAFDAWVTAFRIPNLFRDLLAEGALSAAFVKTFSQTLEKDGEARAFRLAARVMNVLGAAVGLLVLLGVLAAPWIVELMAAGFDPATTATTVLLTRVMFPYLLLAALAAVAMGALNARGVFGVPALASALFNVVSITAGLALAYALEPGFMHDVVRAVLRGEPFARDLARESRALLGMALGVLLGGLAQFLWQLGPLRRQGYRHTAVLDPREEGLRAVLRLMGPAVLGTAAVQINVVVNTRFASHLGEGAVSALNYAFRLMQLPIGIFGVAIATATLPAISRAMSRGDRADYRRTLASSLRLALFLTVPSAVGLIALAEPIVGLIYQRGAFDAADTRATAGALAFYAAGLVGFSLIKILAPAFYAVDDARTPARISVASIGVNLLGCWLLMGPLGHRGLALATALVGTLNAAALLGLLRRRVGPLHGREIAVALLRIAAASAVLWFAARAAHAQLDAALPEGLAARCVEVFGAIAAGGAAFLAACVVLRIEESRRLIDLVRRRTG